MTSLQFYELLYQNNGKIQDLTFNENLNLDFANPKFDLSHFTRIRIENCIFSGSVLIRNLSFENFSFEIKNCEFRNATRQIWENLKVGMFTIDDCTFGSLTINNSEIEDTYIEDCTFERKLALIKLTGVQLSIKTEDKRRKINSIFVNSPNLGTLSINNEIKISELRIYNIQNAYIHGDYEKIEVVAKSFETIEIGNYYKKDKVFSAIDLFQISDLSFEGILTLSDLHINKLNLDNLNIQKGLIRFNEIVINDTSIFDCTVSAFYWNQVKFIKDPEIIRSDLSGLKLTNVTWTKDKKLCDSFLDENIPLLYGLRQEHLKKRDKAYDESDIMEMQYQRDTYRQLKAASIASHNQIESLDFYRNEMRLYWKEIRVNGGVKLYDRVLVFLNRWVSDFGQNWLLPLVWLLAFHFIFVMSLFNWQFSYNYDSFENGLGQYFYLLNPVHKTPEYINSGFGHITEFFMRVFAGFFIYHFVRATRKFGKI
jgi:hypothetical protein